MKTKSKLKNEENIYTPKKNMPRAKIFRSLCEDETYPCRSCTKCKNPMMCLRMENCPEYYIWFHRKWKQLRALLHADKPKPILP